MSRIIYNADTLKIMQIFDSITKSELKDCFIDNNDLLTFVVSKNQMGKAIGKKAANVKRIEQLLKRKIKVVEFSDDITKFIKSLIYPVSTAEISENDQIVTIKL
ncbi:NusA-like transcription termination signal-binding factor, partial [archaeon]|nr:NusA-like transcription termination signal-binding factor [archaeon]